MSIRVGIIGCGKIAQIRHIPEYTANPHMPLGFAYLFLFITMRTDKNVVK